MTVFYVFNAFDRGIGIGEVGVSDVSRELVILSAVPLGVYEKRQAVFKSEKIVAFGVRDLPLQFSRQCAHIHHAKVLNGVVYHLPAPPFFQ
jgi:hypothetical protein